MALRKIALMGHPVLRQRARPVDDVTAPEIQRLIDDMIETMLDAPGVGLAAPQIHESLRLIVFRVPRDRQDTDEPDGPDEIVTLANPVIEPVGDVVVDGMEGCLSMPGLRGIVPRWKSIHYAGMGRDGGGISATATGFHARVVQHEVDHLDGVLYPDRMPDLRYLVFEAEAGRLVDGSLDGFREGEDV